MEEREEERDGRGGGEEEKSLDLKGAQSSISFSPTALKPRAGKALAQEAELDLLTPLPRGRKLCAPAGLGRQGGAFYYSCFPTREGPSSEGKPTGSAATTFKCLLGSRYAAGHTSRLCHLSGHLTVAQACFLGWGRLSSEA